jgi:hypothetical protein
MKKLGLVGCFVLGLLGSAAAQQAVQVTPYPTTTNGGNSSTTITTTNTFQKLFSGQFNSTAPVSSTQGARHGCIIQNNGTHTMYISEGTTIATATLASSYQLLPPGTNAVSVFNCDRGNSVLSGEIDITGTGADAFYDVQF